MPTTSETANRLIAMEVEEARLFYYSHHSQSLDELLPLSGSDFQYVGDMKPTRFERDAISFTQSAYGNRVVARLATGQYTIQSFTVEKPFPLVHRWNDEPVMVAHIRCHGQLDCNIISGRRKTRRSLLPLDEFASQMYFIRIEFRDILSWWKVSSPREGWAIAAVKTQLEQLFALYTTSTLCVPDPEPGHRMPFHLSNTYRLPPSCDPEASPWSEAESSAAANPAYPPPSTRNLPKLSLPTGTSPLTTQAATKALLPQSSHTSTVIQHPRILKRKLDEMIVHYDKIEEEEKKSLASCREKKEKLWADWHSTDSPTAANPQHPASLRRKLEEMEAKYDRIENEEKEVTVRCHEKMEKLWGIFNKVIPPGHRDDNDRER